MKKNKSHFLLAIVALLFLSVSASCKKKESIPDPLLPPLKGTVTDIDGNVYETIRIGTQEWMVENLKTTRYRNGDPIPNVTDYTAWQNLTTGGYCIYENNTDTYGHLYNWFAVDDSRGIAPEGWRVPTEEDWETLYSFAGGGSNKAGGKLKSTGTDHWLSPNKGATNEMGFSGLPGGYRYSNTLNIQFKLIGEQGFWWTSSEWAPPSASGLFVRLGYDNTRIDLFGLDKRDGCSIRCIKN